MNKFVISLLALAAVSTVALANDNRSYDLRDSDTYTGVQTQVLTSPNANVEPLAVKRAVNGSGLTLQELTERAQDERNVD